MSELNVEIEDFIETSYRPLAKEIEFIKDNDWTKGIKLDRRVQEHGLSVMITDRAIKTAKDLHKIAINDLSNKDVKGVMKLCKDIFTIYEQRYHAYTTTQDWTLFTKSKEDLSKAEGEMSFQNDMRNQLNTFKRVMRDINFGEETERIDIKTFKDEPIPLMMREKAEEKFPEILTFLNTAEKDASTKTTNSKRKNVKVPK